MVNNDVDMENVHGDITDRLLKLRQLRGKSVLSKALTREEIKESVENFFESHKEKKLCVDVYLDTKDKKPIFNFYIDLKQCEIMENSSQTELIISNYAEIQTLPIMVNILYEEVINCETTVKTGEAEEKILADALVITFKNGTVLKLGFLNI